MPLLDELAAIETGATFRDKLTHDPEGTVAVVQVRDVAGPYALGDDPVRIRPGKLPSRQFLQPDDILMLAKGSRSPAVRYAKPWPQAVAVSFFLRLRIRDPAIADAGFLTWFLNTAPAQAALHAGRQGSHVATLTKAALAALEVPLPNLPTQRRIALAADALHRETKLADELREKRARAIEYALLTQLS